MRINKSGKKILAHLYNGLNIKNNRMWKSTCLFRNNLILATHYSTSFHLDNLNVSKLNKFILGDNTLDDHKFLMKIKENSENRKDPPDFHNILLLWNKIKETGSTDQNVLSEYQQHLFSLPNLTCPEASKLTEPLTLEEFGTKRIIEDALTLEKLSHHGVEMNCAHFHGRKSYYLRGSMARLEHNLIRYAIKELLREGFTLFSVPDLVTEDILPRCGVPTVDGRTMVFSLDPAVVGPGERVCLSGTAEMALGAWLRGRHFELSQLPLKLCAVSRCYRAEAKGAKHEQGIFRVHNFTKVEMFGVTANETGEESVELYQQLVATQQRLLSRLGLHGKVLLMPPDELGKPAYSKTDIEVWLPGRRHYAELSSASNCTDYQAARLGTTYSAADGTTRLVHTVNGTACAVPRCIIALCETHQEEAGRRAICMPRLLNIPTAEPTTAQHDVAPSTDALQYNLEKIMVYNEQCKRVPVRHIRELNVD